MKWKRVLLLGITVTLLSGCNIVIRVGEGGTVTWSSGSCGPNEECIVSVTDFLFSDVFEANAAPGFEFVGWRKRSRGLCGGSDEPCALSTREFPQNDATRALLGNENETFFLVAQFQSTGGGNSGGSGSGSLSACFNPALYSQGTQATFRYRLSSPDLADFDSEQELMVIGQNTFNSQQALEIQTSLDDIVEGERARVQISSFQIVDAAARRVRVLGSISQAGVDGLNITFETINDPFSLTRFDLAAGESYQDTYTSTTSTELPGVPFAPPQVQVRNVDTYTFLGIESVTVPAGTFQACKVEQVTRGGGETDTTTSWLIVGSGVLAKSEGSDNSGLDLLPGSTLNGNPI